MYRSVFPSEPVEDDLVFLELRLAARTDVRGVPAPLPDWLDLVLCVVAPVSIALGVLLLFRMGALVSAGA